ncbi:hypothetical protein CH72_4204 [Burkholderia ambifaria AMMD]|uniref:ABC-type sugar transport system protein n=1 Tax=Burkholderia ambifaria (strain ATCC BAA-244 / DSM 16087 / CCUG 44356 / LMG 19182 / AMMD) TaxID=339670 RepID=Q0B7Z9_BURCM|nr:DUF4286 family protein [Burkholderia ambifaria]ABI89724.1 conserved hypothetical protein [Burkholderia ambifaria AMMD]AJY25583.1 hypothetical protein CH72_4204 [Burkholderia ambifaria AMMD]MBR7930264.1 hypothetical protein [Burkholderia ambifaria]PEH67835.1 hypothetical protein CRM91_07465 [Burkholderia ambifaria]QQC07624.1 hypothetical protein I6H84_19330 [Burkholderia ambifaria]
MTRLSLPHGQLCVWTDIDPAHEADFNAWYDREHMQERVAIPGFTHARRFRATDGGPRKYLALYVTDTLDVFRGDAYRRAFTQQTAWSLANFERMTGTQRRVGDLTIEAGDGEGVHLALFVLPPERIDVPHLRERFDAALREPGIHAARLFRTAPDLSAPIGADAAARPAADALVLIEGSDAAATRMVAAAIAGHDDVRTFDLMWRAAAPLSVACAETQPAAALPA